MRVAGSGRALLLVAALLGGAALPACRPTAGGAGVAATSSHRRVELIFGRNRHAAPEVSDAEWESFLNDVVTPAFPDGFTVLDGYGQWRQGNGNIEHERSKVLVIIVAAAQFDGAALDRVRAAYLTRFHQQSVLRVVENVSAEFDIADGGAPAPSP